MVKIKGVDEYLLASKSEKNTYQSYRGNLRKFLHYLYPNEVPAYQNKMTKEERFALDKMVDVKSIEYLRIPDLEDRVEHDLTFFKKSLEGQENTKSYAVQVASMWLRECRVDLGESFIKKLSKKREALTEEHVPIPDEVRSIVENLPIIGKAIVLSLSSSGMRPAELFCVKDSDVNWNASPVEVRLKADYTKTGKKRLTFLSSEAVDVIKMWLKTREGWIATQKARTSEYIPNDSIFPISDNSFADLWLRAVEKVGLGQRDENTGRLKCHIYTLRKFFRTYGKWEQSDIAEALMGHVGGIEAVYARFDQAENILREGYLKSEPHLSISANSGLIIDLREENSDLKTEMEERRKNLENKLIATENRLYETQRQVSDIQALMPSMIEEAIKPYLEALNNQVAQPQIAPRVPINVRLGVKDEEKPFSF